MVTGLGQYLQQCIYSCTHFTCMCLSIRGTVLQAHIDSDLSHGMLRVAHRIPASVADGQCGKRNSSAAPAWRREEVEGGGGVLLCSFVLLVPSIKIADAIVVLGTEGFPRGHRTILRSPPSQLRRSLRPYRPLL